MGYSSSSRDPSPSNHSRIPQASDARRQSAALRGASLAFSSPLAPAKPLVNTYSGTDGALAAAAFAGVGRRKKEEEEFGADGSPPRHSAESASSYQSQHESVIQSARSREQSPSHIAAVLAASKSTTKHNPTALLKPTSRRPAALRRSRSDFSPKADGPDDTPIAATDALVKLFEARQVSKRVVSETDAHHQQERSTQLVSPTPVRPPSVGRTSPLASRNYDPSMVANLTAVKPFTLASSSPIKLSISPRISSRSAIASDSSTAENASSVSNHSRDSSTRKVEGTTVDAGPHIPLQKRRAQLVARTKGQVPAPPPPRRSSKRPALPEPKDSGTSSYTNHSAGSSSASSYASAVDQLRSPRSTVERSPSKVCPPSPPPPRLAAPPIINRPPSQPPSRSVSATSTSLDHLPYTIGPYRSTAEPILSLHSLTPQLTASSLANAMVASSLASSRAPSPNKPAPIPTPPPLLRRSKPPFFHRHHSEEQISRTPSPAKGMRHTLRGERSFSNDESDLHRHHKGNRILKKHPHKHHEGDRKRWRESITDKERKRYEGVWAANRGLFLPLSTATNPPTAATGVLNLIVRDIWARSKLSFDDLSEIWDLVDGKGEGWLEKEEFVVGMWLVDQRLKGRKTPVVVGESVWGSVRGLSGVMVKHKR